MLSSKLHLSSLYPKLRVLLAKISALVSPDVFIYPLKPLSNFMGIIFELKPRKFILVAPFLTVFLKSALFINFGERLIVKEGSKLVFDLFRIIDSYFELTLQERGILILFYLA